MVQVMEVGDIVMWQKTWDSGDDCLTLSVVIELWRDHFVRIQEVATGNRITVKKHFLSEIQ